MTKLHTLARRLAATISLILLAACSGGILGPPQQALEFPYVLDTIEPIQFEIDRESDFLVFRVRCISEGEWSGITVRTQTVNGNNEYTSTPPEPRRCEANDTTTPVLAGQIMRLNDLEAGHRIGIEARVDQPQSSTSIPSTLEVGENGVFYEIGNATP